MYLFLWHHQSSKSSKSSSSSHLSFEASTGNATAPNRFLEVVDNEGDDGPNFGFVASNPNSEKKSSDVGTVGFGRFWMLRFGILEFVVGNCDGSCFDVVLLFCSGFFIPDFLTAKPLGFSVRGELYGSVGNDTELPLDTLLRL